MVEVKGAADAEVRARRLIVERHSGVRESYLKEWTRWMVLGWWRGSFGIDCWVFSLLRSFSSFR